MFRGINAINIDPKGRIAVPTRYRDLLLTHAATVILTIDTESPCLLLYPIQEWEQIERKVAELPSFNPSARRIQRLLIGHATEVEMDNAGRLLIPPLLREYANLTKRVMLVGQRNKFELWDESAWLSGRETWINEAAPLPLDSLESLRDLTL